MWGLLPAVLIGSPVDLAYSSARGARRLHESPSVYLTDQLLSAEAVTHILGRVPSDESAWSPCIGQKAEYASKRCALLQVGADDTVLRKALSSIDAAFNVDVSKLRDGGLPLIRYLPGAPSVGIHGDIGATGLVPNATLVVYLTDADASGSGSTYFPHLPISPVDPKAGSVLSFANVDAEGRPDPRAQHGVSSVSSSATRDRVVIQIPLRHPAAAVRPPASSSTSLLSFGRKWAEQRPRGEAYAEHVSGMKHRAHLGIMALLLLGFVAHYIYQNYLSGSADEVNIFSNVVEEPTFKAAPAAVDADGRL